MGLNADAAASDISEASNWAEDAAMYSSDSQLSDWEPDSTHEDPASPQPADMELADALQLADHAITGAEPGFIPSTGAFLAHQDPGEEGSQPQFPCWL